MAKISMLIPDEALAEIDAQAGGNRTAFMVAAAIERARKLKRELTDREIAASIVANEEHDAEVYAQWEATIADGLD
jgi:uncharacterized protein involved in propanediol utilization